MGFHRLLLRLGPEPAFRRGQLELELDKLEGEVEEERGVAGALGEAEPEREFVHLGLSVASFRSSFALVCELTSFEPAANDTNGQIGVSGSNAATVINSPYSTGQNSASGCPHPTELVLHRR